MRKLLLALGALCLWAGVAQAQVPCIGVNGVNSFPQPGVTCNQEPTPSSYAATSVGLVPASSATDIACIAGAANINVRIQQIRISGSAGTAVAVPVTILKRATADTGGTPATSTALPVAYALHSTDPAAKATLVAYTANPTINDSSPGIIDSAQGVFTVTSTLTGVTSFTLFDYSGLRYMEAPQLIKASEQICVNFNAISVSSGVINTTFRWTEASQ